MCMIALGCDHGGFPMMQKVKKYLDELGLAYQDFGTYSLDSCDYPDFGEAAARAVADGNCDRGILVCTTGVGISICANKVRGIRCALCSEPVSAEMSRRHNNANVLAMGGAMIGVNMMKRIVDAFLNTEFEGGRHERRVSKIMAIETR
ncbi:MAG: ribose 5-phosphate isomerase B [Oscillospiraceae bacterium]|nr:ribose 5-phosphate isomerase B [Oscillospiraceae bacterium]